MSSGKVLVDTEKVILKLEVKNTMVLDDRR